MITIKNLRKSFGKLQVLKGVDLTIRPGKITALVGPNGSGKTTLIKTILGLSRPDGGRIVVGGHTLNGDWRYRSQVGYMPQIPPLPENLAAGELFEMLRELRKADAPPDPELVEAFGLAGQLGSPLRTLSGGTRQKVNAVMAFMFNPDLLILDEPTAGLDPLASRHLKARIRRERKAGRTFLITSHVLSELQELADYVVFLLEGRVRFDGSAGELLKTTGEESLEGAVAELMRSEAIE
ncbi:MAG: ABC transporter ATP-binding protein [Gemmatimonadetes bacterium]|nr:ABC transporter ATP-binding protein [Gemmatimonadota bacterium]